MENNNQKNTDQNVELEACKKQAEEYLNNWKRERADFINYKKDEDKKLGEFVKFANEALVLELIEAMDDLYLATKQIKDPGLEQVNKKFEDLLKKYGVEKIVMGDKFDPIYQEIVDGTKGERAEELRAGYTMHGKVIRPARVRIVDGESN